MARVFDDALSQYLSYPAAVLTDEPFTLAVWFWSDVTLQEQKLIAIGDSSVDTDAHSIYLRDTGYVTAQSRDNISINVSATIPYGINAWHHACGVWETSGKWHCYYDGGNKGTRDSGGIGTSGIDLTVLGARARLTKSAYLSGMMAHAAVWNVALTQEEVEKLARGYRPDEIRRTNLVAYWPLETNDQDIVGVYNLTETNGPLDWADGPSMYDPYQGTGHLSLNLPRTQKPKPGAVLDRHNPLTRGLFGAYLFNEGGGTIVKNYAREGYYPTLIGADGDDWHQGQFGPEVYFLGDAANHRMRAAIDPGVLTECTIGLWVHLPSNQESKSLAGARHDDPAENSIWISGDSSVISGGVEVEVTTGEGGLGRAYSSSSLIDSLPHFVVLVWESTPHIHVYVDGVLEDTDDTNTLSPGDTVDLTGVPFEVAGINLDGSSLVQCAMYADSAYFWNRALQAQEIAELYQHPFAMFLPEIASVPQFTVAAAPVPETELVPYSMDWGWRVPKRMKPAVGARLDRNHRLARGMVGGWSFNEGGGTIAHDLSGNGNHGAMSGFASPPTATSGWNYGPDGLALAFDESNDHIVVPDTDSLDVSQGDMSIIALVSRHTTGASNTIIIKQPDSGDWYKAPYHFYFGSTDVLTFRYYNDAGTARQVDSVVTFTDTDWYVVGATKKGGLLSLYVNGLFENSASVTDDAKSSDAAVVIGAGEESPANGRHNGMIGYVLLMNHALSDQEMLEFYQHPYAMFQPPFPQLIALEPPTAVAGAALVPAQVEPAPVTMKPPVGARVNRGHDLSKGLVGAFLFNEGGGSIVHDCVEGLTGVFGGSPAPSWVQGERGPAVQGNTTTAYVGSIGKPLVDYNNNPAWTIVIKHKSSSAGNNDGLIDIDASGDPQTTIAILSKTSGTVIISANVVNDAGDATAYMDGSGTNVDDGKWHTTALVQRARNDRELFFDGVSVATNTTSITTLTPDRSTFLAYGNGASNFGPFDLEYAMTWNRALSQAELLAMTSAPFAMFRWPLLAARGVEVVEDLPTPEAVAIAIISANIAYWTQGVRIVG